MKIEEDPSAELGEERIILQLSEKSGKLHTDAAQLAFIINGLLEKVS
ncbi:MAG: hypothetical protein H0U57_01740 [Tatlockia sp.]|nr:hypothetical protein [Tatlockia sp.]